MKVLDEELQTAMRLLGANTVDQLGTQHVGLPAVTVECRLMVYRPSDQYEGFGATNIRRTCWYWEFEHEGILEAMIVNVNVKHSVAAIIINVFPKTRPHSIVYHLFGKARLRTWEAFLCALYYLPITPDMRAKEGRTYSCINAMSSLPSVSTNGSTWSFAASLTGRNRVQIPSLDWEGMDTAVHKPGRFVEESKQSPKSQ